MGDGDGPAVTNLLAERQRLLVVLTGHVVVAAVLGHDAEVGEQAADAGGVAETPADLQARLVALDRQVVLPLLRAERAGEVVHLGETRIVGGDLEGRGRRLQPVGRLGEVPLSPRLLGERGVAPPLRPCVAEPLGDDQRLVRHRLRALPVARQLTHLAEPQQHVDALALGQERDSTLVVVDGGRVGVVGLGRLAGEYEVLALLRRVVAEPVVVGEEVDLMLDGIGLGLLDERPDALVEHRPRGEGQTPVGHLLRDDVAEAVGLVDLPVEGDEIGGAQRDEIGADGVPGAELGIDAGERGGEERPPQHAGDLDRAARRLVERVDAAEDQAVQAARCVERAQGGLVLEVDALAADEVEQLLDVERVAARACRDQLDQRLGRLGARTEELFELDADQPLGVLGFEIGQRELRELRQPGETEVAAGLRARAVVEDPQHREPDASPHEDLEEVAATADRSSGSPPRRGRAVRRRREPAATEPGGPPAMPCAASDRAAASGRCRGS